LGYDALETGKKIMPLSIGLVIFSVLGSKMVTEHSPRKIVRIGQVLLVFGSLVLVGTISPELNSLWFSIGMLLTGSGLGLLASQIGNINMSSVGKEDTAEAGGLQGVFQNLGSSIGTALIGSVFIAALIGGFATSINESQLSQSTKEQVISATENGIGIVSIDQAEKAVLDAGLSQAEATEISQQYQDAQIAGLKKALFFLTIVGLLSIALSRELPKRDPR
jgi:MFS family permease